MKFEDFSYAKYLSLSPVAIEGSVIESYGMFLTLAIIAVIAGFVMAISYCLVPSTRPKIKTWLQETKKDTFWSGSIKSTGVEYILLITPMIIQLKSLMDGV
jgi:hypothetical protein